MATYRVRIEEEPEGSGCGCGWIVFTIIIVALLFSSTHC